MSLRLALGATLFVIYFSYFYLHSPNFNWHILLLHPEKKLSKNKRKYCHWFFNLKRNRTRTEMKNISVNSDWLHCYFFFNSSVLPNFLQRLNIFN